MDKISELRLRTSAQPWPQRMLAHAEGALRLCRANLAMKAEFIDWISKQPATAPTESSPSTTHFLVYPTDGCYGSRFISWRVGQRLHQAK